MQTQATKRLWYEGKTGSHQGLIIEEETGRNIAVTYDKADTAFIVRAVNNFDAMREALEAIVARIEGDFDHAALVKQGVLTLDSKADIKGFAKAALALAKGERAE